MTRHEAAIISAYTGIFIGYFTDFHRYVEYLMDRPVMTYELDDPEVSIRIKELAKPDFMNIDVAG
jgi:hypothetical protein